jgi:hypothetical protein
MLDRKSNKSSMDYAELAGLRIALSNIKSNGKDDLRDLEIIEWLNMRITSLALK